ncbi:hypothetical protein Pcar_2887 [Syntrophotalea carbinolica DSM 2380]|uniref:Uncharacterized protein n=1 Tax=Syntrophotalea carbinolica (strain DSM 2380 / NBRC 103641 / GraBd1) TaxID=338963 RepID=Q3A0I5_SYNC1|nr:hypothetical protein [Syntrophotalea carbinolica]ABA90122.1 hypothetical protein Pcar_2887 [Syntrophotalea carbinolica DSM 2380]
MPNYFEISPTDDALSLQQGKGAAGFTVRYVGERPVEAKAEAVALQGADQAWLQVAQPTTKQMQSNQTQTFKVLVNVPPGTPVGRYGLRLDVMSVDNTDEEYNQGPVVAFEVGEASAASPKKQKGFPWWTVIVSAVVLVMVAGGITWWVMNRSKTTEINFSEAAAGVIAADTYLDEGISVVETKPKSTLSANALRETRLADRLRVSGRVVSPTLPVKVKPAVTYCADALPAILPAGSYRLPEAVLSTASPDNTNKCNGVELSFKLQRPATKVSIAFFGAKAEYQLRAYDRDGNELGTDTASATPYEYDTPSIVEVSSEDALIDHFEFGHQKALTMIKSIEITTTGRE